MKLPRWYRPMFEVRWNEDRTVGEIWRVRNYPGYPPAPIREGTIRKGWVRG